MFSRSKARRFLYEDSEEFEDSDPPPEYVYFLISLVLFNYLLVSFNLDFVVWLKLRAY